ncbi:MAG: hypothetical protein WDO19_29425 [Bacteroidota bacterium]
MPYFIVAVLLLPITYLSNNFLDINSTPAEIGYYNLASKLTSPISLVLSFALSALFPNLASIWVTDKERFLEYIKGGVKILIIIMSTICFLFTLFSKEIIVLLFSKDYSPAIRICQLEAWYYVLMGVNSMIGVSLGASDKEKVMLKTTLVNLLSQRHCFIGEVCTVRWAMAYAYIVSFSIFEFYLWNKFKRTFDMRIKDDYLFWLISALMFFLSFFFLVNLALWIRLIASSRGF